MDAETMNYSLADVEKNIGCAFNVIGNRALTFNSIDPIVSARSSSLSWLRGGHTAAAKVLASCPASFIICQDCDVDQVVLERKCLVRVANPQTAFLRLLKNLYGLPPRKETFIHPTAVVSEQARLGTCVYIGEYAFIGDCEIGNATVIKAHSTIHDGSVVGSNVLISEYCNIGGEGFGHIRNERGLLENMIHIGHVVIEDEVEIFPYTNIDRATLSETRIGRGSKIDHFCHIGHNSIVGSGTIIAAKVVMCGSSVIGNGCWIGVGSVLKDGIIISDNVTIGMGSMITKSVPEGETWIGSPARPLDVFKDQQQKVNRL
jgi:UDP-3-O-[3-hydroxymyristoyl] glucosamine N-acyltransferase